MINNRFKYILNQLGICKNKSNHNILNYGGLIANSNKLFSLYMSICCNKDNSIIVASNNNEAELLYEISKNLYYKEAKIHNKQILFLPSNDISPYQKISPNKITSIQRVNTLSQLCNNSTSSIIITSAAGFLQKTLPSKLLKSRVFDLKINEICALDDLLDFLKDNHYENVSVVHNLGEFALRGDIVDVYTPNEGPIRIDFFDNTIEQIRVFNTANQISTHNLEKATIQPSSEIILDDDNINKFKINYEKIFGKKEQELFELLNNKILPRGIENYLSLFYDDIATILDYSKAKNIYLLNNSIENIFNEIQNDYDIEFEYRQKSNSIFHEQYGALDVNKLIIDQNELKNIFINKQINKITLSAFYQVENENTININCDDVVAKFDVYKKNNKDFFRSIIQIILDNKNCQFLIFAQSEEFIENLTYHLNQNSIEHSIKVNDLTNYNIKCTIIQDKSALIQEGFQIGNIFILTEAEITGIKKTFSTNKIKRKIKSNIVISKGDILVHSKYGFGKCNEIVTLTVNNAEHDFLEILYRDNEKLFVPVENLDILTRYSSENDNITLDKLGSPSFEKKQKKAKERIKDIAYELVQMAAKRKLKTSLPMPYSLEDYSEFCAKFPFVETEDQKNAILDIINDFNSGKATDRLICGDVGFGKTEIAMRAAFLAVSSGYQVAVLTPTTLLCNQHYMNFKKRFEDFPIKIAQSSRLVSTKNKKELLQQLQNGTVDIVIGTHSLVSNNVHFKNIGLLIIDEEQSFGVVHKEKIKSMKEELHVLTMSATPIPRTMEQAFKDLKDLSLITTPPVDKLPIHTYTLPFDISSIKNAILKEKARNGQVYFVCPKISDIDEIKILLDKLQLDITYTVVHGKMPIHVLENNMFEFQNKKYDLLLSTNIIESGLDLSNVNTIIIYKSHIFGLAQLYQLRGRVGRSNLQSYAYLLYDSQNRLTPLAEKRLQILQNLDYLGASFALANYDLDLRGAGNLLGEEQSGHIKDIGVELYQKILHREIQLQKTKLSNINNKDDYIDFVPKINLNVPTLIPKKYIPDMNLSMEIYQDIANIENLEDISPFKIEIENRFGRLPDAVENLFLSIELKILAKKASIEKIDSGTKAIIFTFFQGKFNNVDGLLKYIEEKKGLITLKSQESIMYNLIDATAEKQISTIKEVLKKLIDIT